MSTAPDFFSRRSQAGPSKGLRAAVRLISVTLAGPEAGLTGCGGRGCIGAAAPVAAAMAIVVAGAATGERWTGHHATGAMVWQAGPGARLVA